jgi:hypothetical protein
VTTNQVLFGLALTVVLAVGSQVLARNLRIPALNVVLAVAGLSPGRVNTERSAHTRGGRSRERSGPVHLATPRR